MNTTKEQPGTQAPKTHTVTFPADEKQVSHARKVVHETLSNWGLACHSYNARLITSELVTNAIRHTDTETIHLWVVLLAHDIEIRVWDSSPKLPGRQAPTFAAEDGRGLFVVALYATGGWGSDNAEDGSGKVTWARIAL